MKHIDLFSGIGGFSLAFDNIFHEQKNTHIFCEIDPFCQAVLRKHWPDALVFEDIDTIVTHPDLIRCLHGQLGKQPTKGTYEAQRQSLAGADTPFILTGGFPCQPFSQAGRRSGTKDDRYLWPAMFSVIQHQKPEWVIAENVRGLVTWNEGMVLEQVCADLESAGYEVQPIIIPAVAVNAPHRRDRVWFVAHRKSTEAGSNEKGIWRVSVGNSRGTKTDAPYTRQQYGSKGRDEGVEKGETKRTTRKSDLERCSEDDANTSDERLERRKHEIRSGHSRQSGGNGRNQRPDWNQNWLEVATRLCRVDAKLSYWVDGRGKRVNSRNARLKALGNAIVPAVAEQIMLAIKQTCGTIET